jgi:hypothetical protein
MTSIPRGGEASILQTEYSFGFASLYRWAIVSMIGGSAGLAAGTNAEIFFVVMVEREREQFVRLPNRRTPAQSLVSSGDRH